MATRIPYTPFGKKMKITTVEQGIPQQESVKRLGIVSPTASDIIYDRGQCKYTKERVVETLGARG